MAIDWSHDIAEFIQPFKDYWYWHVISCAAWFTIHFLSGFIYSKIKYVELCVDSNKLADERRGKKTKPDSHYYSHAKWEMSIKTTALVHSIISSAGSLYTIYQSYPEFSPNYEDLYTVIPAFRIVCGISTGYFLYDLIIALIGFDLPFIAHGSLSYTIYAHSLRPFCSRLGGFFLFYEVSTIFLNLRALMIATQNTKNFMFPIIEKLFFLLFILCRLVIGLTHSSLYTIPYLGSMLLFDTPKAPHSYIATFIFIMSNVVLNCLNVMWTVQIINTIRRSAKRQADIANQEAQLKDKKND